MRAAAATGHFCHVAAAAPPRALYKPGRDFARASATRLALSAVRRRPATGTCSAAMTFIELTSLRRRRYGARYLITREGQARLCFAFARCSPGQPPRMPCISAPHHLRVTAMILSRSQATEQFPARSLAFIPREIRRYEPQESSFSICRRQLLAMRPQLGLLPSISRSTAGRCLPRSSNSRFIYGHASATASLLTLADTLMGDASRFDISADAPPLYHMLATHLLHFTGACCRCIAGIGHAEDATAVIRLYFRELALRRLISH